MSLAASMVPRVDKYDLLEEIGHGGMATVYRARDPRLSRDVAVKVIHRHLRESAEVGRRFTAEARAVAKLRHPNIVEIYDVADDDAPERYLVAELVTGGSLRKILTEHAPLPAEIVACIGVEIADGLAHAHERGVVHRDVKPENVLFEIPQGSKLHEADAELRVKLTDFGIAKMLDQQGVTATGQVLGSPAYMAPEQIECGDIDARSDVFGLGVLLYESMVGHLPFEGKNPAQVLRRVLDGIYPPADQELPTVGNKWSTIVATALAMRVEDRFPDMEHVRDELLVELRQLGIDDPRRELLAFFRDPAGYREALATRLVPVLVERGKKARKDDDVVGAAGHFNRALAFAPHDVALLTLVSGMTRRRERKTLAIRLAGVVGILAVSMGGAYLALRPRIRPAVVPPPADSSPIASAEPVREPTPPAIPSGTTSARTAPSGRTVTPPSVVVTTTPSGPGTAVDREVRFTVNIPAALISIDGGPAEELHGASRTLKTGIHSFAFQMTEATRACCKPSTGSFAVRDAPAGKVADVSVYVNLNPAKLAVDGPASDQVFCGFFTGGRQANGIIEVPLRERSMNGRCHLQSSPSTEKEVTIRPGTTTTLRF